jgi:hypothetical protein
MFSCFLLSCGAPHPASARHKINGGDAHHGDDRCRDLVCQPPGRPEIRFGALTIFPGNETSLVGTNLIRKDEQVLSNRLPGRGYENEDV